MWVILGKGESGHRVSLERTDGDVMCLSSGRGVSHSVATRVEGEDSKARWQRIADGVPGRSLKECVERYKEIRSKLQAAAAAAAAGGGGPVPAQPPPPPATAAAKDPPARGLYVAYRPPAPPAASSQAAAAAAAAPTARDRYLSFQAKQLEQPGSAVGGGGRGGGGGSGGRGGAAPSYGVIDEDAAGAAGWWRSLDEGP